MFGEESRLLGLKVLQNFVRETRGRWDDEQWRVLVTRVRRIGFESMDEARLRRLAEDNRERWLSGENGVGPPPAAPPAAVPAAPVAAPAPAGGSAPRPSVPSPEPPRVEAAVPSPAGAAAPPPAETVVGTGPRPAPSAGRRESAARPKLARKRRAAARPGRKRPPAGRAKKGPARKGRSPGGKGARPRR